MKRFPLLNCAVIVLLPNLVGCKTRRVLPDPMQENTLPAPPKKPNAMDENQTKAAIELSAQSDQTVYNRGDVIKFTLVAHNTSDSEQKLIFTSGRSFDLTATPQNEPDAIWHWSRDKVFTMSFKTIALQPDERRTFTATWNQTADNGQLAPRGTYSIVAELPATGNPLSAAPITLELR